KGMSLTEIAQSVGQTRQNISRILREYNMPRDPRRALLEDNYPWIVAGEHNQAYLYRLTRDRAEDVVTGGKGMPEKKLKRVRGFYKKLREKNFVVEYDPNIPPGEFKTGGWAYRERVPADGELIIRVYDYTDINDENEYIWEFPDQEP